MVDSINQNEHWIKDWRRMHVYWTGFQNNYWTYVKDISAGFMAEVVVYDEIEMWKDNMSDPTFYYPY